MATERHVGGFMNISWRHVTYLLLVDMISTTVPLYQLLADGAGELAPVEDLTLFISH